MIVLYGRLDDRPFAQVAEAAGQAGVEHQVVDQNRLGRCRLVTRSDGPGGRLDADGLRIALEDITALYTRPLQPRYRSGAGPEQARAAGVHQRLVDWLDGAPALVVNRPCAMESNSSKPYQSQLIARAGFLVPDTLVTNEPDDVREFVARHGRVIYKSVSGVRSIVRDLTAADEDRLDLVRHLPTQFQEYVPGPDVRVHVVGDRVLAAQVESTATDYRYATRDEVPPPRLHRVDPPTDVSERCVALAAALRLPFAGIDLRVRPDCAWVCFEVNPMPGFTYYQDRAGLPIASAVVDLLIRGASADNLV
ncbi:RimK family alpha-L-glutamate ligase [Streptomyces sp. SAS_269]|uniref:ATP-grasp domain-containing protein n=1 Tax=Streptomyces sp. SAS_269 TaxID=3412749 RepID=UPI00403C3182